MRCVPSDPVTVEITDPVEGAPALRLTAHSDTLRDFVSELPRRDVDHDFPLRGSRMYERPTTCVVYASYVRQSHEDLRDIIRHTSDETGIDVVFAAAKAVA